VKDTKHTLKILMKRMNAYGYAIFTVRPDKKFPSKSVIQVYQDIKRLGITPQFWLIMDGLDLSGFWGDEYNHQTSEQLPEGTYLTFV
jgi:hypothetical protein